MKITPMVSGGRGLWRLADSLPRLGQRDSDSPAASQRHALPSWVRLAKVHIEPPLPIGSVGMVPLQVLRGDKYCTCSYACHVPVAHMQDECR